MNIGDLIFSLLADGSRLEGDITKQAGAAADKAGVKAGGTLGSRMADGLRKNTAAVGAAAGYLFAGAIESGAKFEDQLRTINTVAGLSDEELSKVGDNIQALSRETGKTTDDLTAGFYDLVSAGVPAADAIGVLRDSAKFATGALGTTAESVDLVTSAMNAYGLSASDSTRITDIFAKSVADGKVTAAQLGTSIANIAPIAASAGVKLEEVAAGYALLTAKGVPAAQAATEMRAAISALLTPNAQLNEIQKQTGINFAELARAKGLAVALEQLRKATNGNADAFAKSLGSIEGYQYALATTGDNASAMADEIVAASNSAGLATQQYDEKSKSSVEQAKRFSATLTTLAQDFGQTFSAAGPFLLTLNQMGPAFRGLLSPAKLLGGLIGGIAGKIGAPLVGAITSAIGSAEIGTRLETLGIRAQTLWIKGMTRFGDPAIAAVGGLFEKLGDTSGGAFVKNLIAKVTASRIGSAIIGAVGPIAIPVAISYVLGQAAQGIQDQNAKDLHDALTKTLEAGTDQAYADFDTHLSQLEHGARASHNDSWLNIVLGEKAAFHAGLQARAADIKDGAQFAAGVGISGFVDGLKDDANVFKAIGTFVGKVKDDLTSSKGMAAAGHRAGNLAGSEVAQGILEKRNAVDQSWQSLLDAIKNAITPTKERAKLVGYLASTELAKGLKSGDPAVRAQAQATKQVIIDRLNALGANAHNIGRDGMEALRKAIKSKDPDIRAAATAILNAAKKPIAKLPAAGTAAGHGVGVNLVSQLDDERGRVGAAATRLGNLIARNILGGLLYGGTSSAKTGKDDIYHRASGGPIVAGSAYLVNEQTPRSEVLVPSRSGYVLTRAQAEAALAGGSGGGTTNVFDVKLEGLVRARDPIEIAREMRRVAAFSPAIARTRPSYTTGPT